MRYKNIHARTPVYTQDQLDKMARERGIIRVVPPGFRKAAYDEAMPTHWFYSDKIKEISDNYTTAYESGSHRKRMLMRE